MEAAAAVTLRVNGHQREAPTGWTVADLVAELAPDVRMVAVERNGAIVPRAEWSATALAQGDRLEIVRFVQGG